MFGAQGLVSRNTQTNGLSPAGTLWYAFDERGSVAQRTGGNGAVLSTDLYDGFGKQRSGAADVFGFGGQAGYYTDVETGLILCTNRHYDPQQGRFLTRDPLGYGGGINLYSYTGNNPVNWSDPDGTQAVIPAPVFYAGAGLLIWWYLTHTGYQPGPISWPWSHPTTVFPGEIPHPAPPNHASGGNSREAYDHEQEKLANALAKEKELMDKLGKATGPKTRRPIEAELDKLRNGDNGIDGHRKKIKQRWPDGCPTK